MTRRLLITFVSAACLVAPGVAGSQRAPTLKVLAARGATPDVGIKIFVPTGSVRLVAWDHDSIVARGHVGPHAHFFFAHGEGKSSYKLGVEPQPLDAQVGPCEFVIDVPRRAKISVKAVDAAVTAEGVGGWFYTVSGAIHLSGDAEHVEAESIRGDVDLDVASMLVKARTGRGHMIVRGSPQDVDASTVGGPLDIATSTILRGRFGSVTGNIRYAATPAPGGVFEFSDHAGSVDLLLPRSASSKLELSSVTGAIANGFTQVSPASAVAHSLTVRLGSGDAHMTVRTFKGAIRLLPQ